MTMTRTLSRHGDILMVGNGTFLFPDALWANWVELRLEPEDVWNLTARYLARG